MENMPPQNPPLPPAISVQTKTRTKIKTATIVAVVSGLAVAAAAAIISLRPPQPVRGLCISGPRQGQTCASLSACGGSRCLFPGELPPPPTATITPGPAPASGPTCGSYKLVGPVYDSAQNSLGFRGCGGTGFRTSTEIKLGMLVKVIEDDQYGLGIVYYIGQNGKRYVFPRITELASWYGTVDSSLLPNDADACICKLVVNVSAEAIARIQIAGNVTLRPGSYVIGSTADAKRYVVGPRGTAQLVTTNAVLSQIYPDVAARTRLLPDWLPLSTSYAPGPTITAASQYDARAVFNAAKIEVDGIR